MKGLMIALLYLGLCFLTGIGCGEIHLRHGFRRALAVLVVASLIESFCILTIMVN